MSFFRIAEDDCVNSNGARKLLYSSSGMIGSGRLLRYLRNTLETSCTVYPCQFIAAPKFGGEAKICCNWRTRLAEPLSRNIPCVFIPARC